MNTNTEEIIVTVKTIKSDKDKSYFYERFGDDRNWRRIGKQDFLISVKLNVDYALETEFNENHEVTFMRYKLDNERLWKKWGLKPITKKYIDSSGNLVIDIIMKKAN